ncbi:MAG TPA: septum formation inhibitor Maf [Candidatus Blautia avistercoris]|uniref:Maf family protein n=1 Tax=Blautia sp. An249 TaxID=1965603 RepID=UPI000B37477D|nr:Maf family protein [Blautia sp. An249]OUO77740.1 septum formation inhibitor Maf [Blautia sp. An249]HIY17887.1 septum formation inhibitor Maf [Candidatus Blautia avistercoris]
MGKILLASASPRRKEILQKAGVRFSVSVSQEEETITKSAPDEVVEELAGKKAYAVLKQNQEEGILVIGADTVVSLDGEILGKPKDEEEAVSVLMRLQGRTHEVYTGVAVLRMENGEIKEHVFSECTKVEFYPVSRKEIEDYVATREPMDKAGSYGIQGAFSAYVKGIRGDYYNVVGLPVGRLFWEMKKAGISLREEE